MGCAKGDDCLAEKVIAFQKDTDDSKGLSMSVGTAQQYRIVLVHSFCIVRDSRAEAEIILFLVSPPPVGIVGQKPI